MNPLTFNTAEKTIDVHHSVTDIASFESILKRQICLEDAALSNKNKHPLKRLFEEMGSGLD